MPRNNVKVYSILISCPSDVNEYLDTIEECIKTFNKTTGIYKNIMLETRHWSTDVYPEFGKRPQESINDQIVRDSDAVIAIFWTKFGTPTDKYGSGTEEEIEEMISLGKQVFLYFLDIPKRPSETDQDQYQKVTEFKAKCKNRGIYSGIIDKNELKYKLTLNLNQYFENIDFGTKNQTNLDLIPRLEIKNQNLNKDNSNPVFKYDLINKEYMESKRKDIVEVIKELNRSVIKRLNLNIPENLNTSAIYRIHNENTLLGISKFNNVEKINIDDHWKDTIIEFVKSNNITLNENFWDIGNLKIRKPQYATLFSNPSPDYIGSDKEKVRYLLIKDLYFKIEMYNEYIEYFTQIEEINFLNLCVCNSGTIYDEDIDIKLIIPKGCLKEHQDLSYPGENIINEILNKKIIEILFSTLDSENIDRYEYYSIASNTNKNKKIRMPFEAIDKAKKYEELKNQYDNLLNSIFLYKEFISDENDILKFHIKYLKHNSSMAFPSVLMFDNVPDSIEYEISSKYLPEITKGNISLK